MSDFLPDLESGTEGSVLLRLLNRAGARGVLAEEAADLGLIERSARELLKMIEVKKIQEAVYLPRPGCGNGRLKWEGVKKILSPILKSDQFHIVTYSRTDS